MKEQRKYMRFNLLLDALCKIRGDKSDLKVNNFSRTGLGVTVTKPLEMGDDIEIEMLIPGDNVPVVVSGEITWTKALNEKHAAGVKFKNINNNDRNKLLEFIYNKWTKKD